MQVKVGDRVQLQASWTYKKIKGAVYNAEPNEQGRVLVICPGQYPYSHNVKVVKELTENNIDNDPGNYMAVKLDEEPMLIATSDTQAKLAIQQWWRGATYATCGYKSVAIYASCDGEHGIISEELALRALEQLKKDGHVEWHKCSHKGNDNDDYPGNEGYWKHRYSLIPTRRDSILRAWNEKPTKYWDRDDLRRFSCHAYGKVSKSGFDRALSQLLIDGDVWERNGKIGLRPVRAKERLFRVGFEAAAKQLLAVDLPEEALDLAFKKWFASLQVRELREKEVRS